MKPRISIVVMPEALYRFVMASLNSAGDTLPHEEAVRIVRESLSGEGPLGGIIVAEGSVGEAIMAHVRDASPS